MKVMLTGFMGSGKTTLGKKLARKLDVKFIDLDHRIASDTGYEVSEIFLLYGEQVFRQAEKMALHDILETDEDLVLSTGGGTPCFFDNMDYMNKKGLTIYLRYNEGMLVSRLKRGKKNRPLIEHIDDKSLKRYIKNKLKEREPCYLMAGEIAEEENLKVADLVLRCKKHFDL